MSIKTYPYEDSINYSLMSNGVFFVRQGQTVPITQEYKCCKGNIFKKVSDFEYNAFIRVIVPKNSFVTDWNLAFRSNNSSMGGHTWVKILQENSDDYLITYSLVTVQSTDILKLRITNMGGHSTIFTESGNRMADYEFTVTSWASDRYTLEEKKELFYDYITSRYKGVYMEKFVLRTSAVAGETSRAISNSVIVIIP